MDVLLVPVILKFSKRYHPARVQRICGPAQTGLEPKLVTRGLDRLRRRDHAGAMGPLCHGRELWRLWTASLMVRGSTTSTWSSAGSHPFRNDCGGVRWSSENFATSASSGSPSSKFTPGRSLMVTSLPSAEGLSDSVRHDVLRRCRTAVYAGTEHDTADVGAANEEIENVRVLGDADA